MVWLHAIKLLEQNKRTEKCRKDLYILNTCNCKYFTLKCFSIEVTLRAMKSEATESRSLTFLFLFSLSLFLSLNRRSRVLLTFWSILYKWLRQVNCYHNNTCKYLQTFLTKTYFIDVLESSTNLSDGVGFSIVLMQHFPEEYSYIPFFHNIVHLTQGQLSIES